MPNSLRMILLAVALALLTLPRGCTGKLAFPNLPARDLPLAVETRPVPLNPGDPGQQTVGSLIYRGGLELSSRESHFGGFSGLLVSPDGSRLLALSDHGYWMSARPTYDQSGDLTGLEQCRLGPILGPEGRPYSVDYLRDSEELSRGPNGSVLVSFELFHRIQVYPAAPSPLAAAPLETWELPPWLRRADQNKGVEALTELPGDRLLMVTEGLWGSGNVLEGALKTGGAWRRITYRPSRGFRPTSAASLGQGDALFLERLFSFPAGARIRVMRVEAAQIRPGGMLTPRLVAELSYPLTVDNFEGLDVRRDARGRTLVYLISDDNYSPLQSTLLLMFELEQSATER